MLDGRSACTHWMYADAFRKRFPRVELRPDVLFVEDDGIFTSAGGAAAIDLSMHLVGVDHGREAANTVSRMLVYSGNRDGEQQQYVNRPVPRTRDASLAPLLQWAEAELTGPIGVAQLAERAAMSPATLHRRFRSELGCTPLEWLNGQRVDLARRLIETTSLDFEAIAVRSGLGTAASLRIHMRQRLGVTPSAYRQRFAQTARPAVVLDRYPSHPEAPSPRQSRSAAGTNKAPDDGDGTRHGIEGSHLTTSFVDRVTHRLRAIWCGRSCTRRRLHEPSA